MEKCGLAVGPTSMPIGGAPTVEEFKAAWIAAGKGDEISGRDAEMQEHILEADLELEQVFLKSFEVSGNSVRFTRRFQRWNSVGQRECLQFKLRDQKIHNGSLYR